MNKPRNNIFTIFKKEMKRFFGDKRLVLATILPGVLIYILYSLMGTIIPSAMGPDKDHIAKMRFVNKPAFIETMLSATSSKYEILTDEKDAEAIKKDINKGDLDIYIVFPENFEEKVQNYQPGTGEKAPHVEIYYNSAKPDSQVAYSLMTTILNAYESALSNKFDINLNPEIKYDQAEDSDMTAMMFSSILPMLILVMIFSACMSIVPESVAGEKERGTIATLLVTPLKRSHLAIGKITALSCISLLSGMCSFVGVMLSLPKLMMGAGDVIDASIYAFGDYMWILLVILSSVLFFTSLISILSTVAKSVKEAMSYISPVMALVTLIGLSGMFVKPGELASIFYIIPFFNSAQAFASIFSLHLQPVNLIITVVSNALYTGILIFALTRMFNSEKIMFRK